VPRHCRYDIMREDKVGSVSRSEKGFLEFAAATFFEVNYLSQREIVYFSEDGKIKFHK
jgi:hypothetical protein